MIRARKLSKKINQFCHVLSTKFIHGMQGPENFTKICPKLLSYPRLVVLESGVGLESRFKSIFAGLGPSPLSIFTVHICSVLFRPYDIWPTRIVHTTKDLRYLLNIYCGINTWTCLFRFHLHCIDFFAAGTYCN